MLVLETVLRIRREHAAGKAIKAIMRDLHLSRRVVRKAIRSPEADMGYRREVQPLPKLGPFQAGAYRAPRVFRCGPVDTDRGRAAAAWNPLPRPRANVFNVLPREQ
jgi:hypothetical protein